MCNLRHGLSLCHGLLMCDRKLLFLRQENVQGNVVKLLEQSKQGNVFKPGARPPQAGARLVS